MRRRVVRDWVCIVALVFVNALIWSDIARAEPLPDPPPQACQVGWCPVPKKPTRHGYWVGPMRLAGMQGLWLCWIPPKGRLMFCIQVTT